MALVAVSGGMDKAVARWESLTDSAVVKAVLGAAEEVSWDLVAEIEKTAHGIDNERWGHVAGYFEPMPGGGVWIPPSYPESREAFALEYGTLDRAPLPVMRSSITRTWRAHSAQFSAGLERRLFGG